MSGGCGPRLVSSTDRAARSWNIEPPYHSLSGRAGYPILPKRGPAQWIGVAVFDGPLVRITPSTGSEPTGRTLRGALQIGGRLKSRGIRVSAGTWQGAAFMPVIADKLGTLSHSRMDL